MNHISKYNLIIYRIDITDKRPILSYKWCKYYVDRYNMISRLPRMLKIHSQLNKLAMQ